MHLSSHSSPGLQQWRPLLFGETLRLAVFECVKQARKSWRGTTMTKEGPSTWRSRKSELTSKTGPRAGHTGPAHLAPWSSKRWSAANGRYISISPCPMTMRRGRSVPRASSRACTCTRGSRFRLLWCIWNKTVEIDGLRRRSDVVRPDKVGSECAFLA